MAHALDTGASATRARRDQITALFAAGGLEACRDAVLAEVATGDAGSAWCTDFAAEVMATGDLRGASALIDLLARTTWGSTRRPARHADGRAVPPPPAPPRPRLSTSKLRHDADQFDLLRRRGLVGAPFDAVINDYREIADRLATAGDHQLVDLTGDDASRIAHVYNRIVHVAEAPRVARAVSHAWSPVEVESRFRAHPPGLAVVDDVLTPAALAGLTRFCQESTLWSGNEDPHGDLRSSFFDGFTCPLLVQLAEEVQTGLPQVVGGRPLVTLTGSKGAAAQGHASPGWIESGGVTVVVWLTPTAANLDPESGGLEIGDAPGTTVPYRGNRAVVLGPGLRHRSEAASFAPDYERRRVAITLRFGAHAGDPLG